MIIKFKITNITCEACIKISKTVLNSFPGVKKVAIEKDGLTTIESDKEIAWENIKAALAKVDKKAIKN